LAIGGDDGYIKIWNLTNDSLLENIKGHNLMFILKDYM
jgi:hypothetical protein